MGVTGNDYLKAPYEWLLRNLLSMIHGDGGRYTAAHGIGKSYREAVSILVEYLRDRDNKAG